MNENGSMPTPRYIDIEAFKVSYKMAIYAGIEALKDKPIERDKAIAVMYTVFEALDAFQTATIESPRDWTPCAEGLPKNECKGVWEEYEVTVCESHYPTSSYDPCDAPYSKEIVTTALFDDEQKIWHICRSKEAINALLNEEDYPLNGDAIIAWRDMPATYNPDHMRDTTKKVDQFREPTKMIEADDASKWPDWKKRAALCNYEFGKED